MKLNLLDMKGKYDKHMLEELLPTLTEKQTKDLLEQTEYYYLCYPQGTGDDDLEQLLEDLYDLLVPET
jgi:hypothetical protein